MTSTKNEPPQNYNPQEAEVKWQNYWKENKIFNFDEK